MIIVYKVEDKLVYSDICEDFLDFFGQHEVDSKAIENIVYRGHFNNSLNFYYEREFDLLIYECSRYISNLGFAVEAGTSKSVMGESLHASFKYKDLDISLQLEEGTTHLHVKGHSSNIYPDYRFSYFIDVLGFIVILLETHVVEPKKFDRHKYYMNIADAVSMAATCDRRHVGAIIVSRDNRVISTGYNGAPSGLPHCDEVGHLVKSGHCVRSIHAEANAIMEVLDRGYLKGATLYVNTTPCSRCISMIIQSGITKVLYKPEYTSEEDLLSFIRELGLNVTSTKHGDISEICLST